jgi:hypothetical protein
MANTVAAQLQIGGVFTSKTAFIEEGITATIGPDPDSGTQPSKLELTWDNSDLSMDPSNVLSPLYGQIGRYTPVRLQVGGTTLIYAEAQEWAPDRSINHQVTPARGRSWTDFTAFGVLDRIKAWKEPLRSPMYLEITSYASLLGYWPLEGSASGSTLLNETAGPSGLAAGSVTFGGDPGPSGSDTVVQLGSDGQISGTFTRASGNGYQVCWAMRLPNALTATNLTVFSFITTDGVRFEWQTSNTQFTFNVIAADGTVLNSIGSLFGGVSPLSWMRCRIKVTYAAGTVTVEPAWYAQDAASILGITFTYAAGGTGRPKTWSVTPNTYTSSAAYSHVFAVTDTTLDLAGGWNPTRVFNGYDGERALDRWARLLEDAGFTPIVVGDSTTTVPMGPQKPGLLFDLLEECVSTDGALQYDEPAFQGCVTFRCRNDRYGQTSKLDLTYGVNVAPPLQKIIGTSGIANRITVNDASGASATVELASGPMSIQTPPAGIGEVRGQIDVNYQAVGLLDDRAAWELRMRTLDRPRYRQITVDLLANPSLTTACNNLRPGDLITLAGVEPDPILLHVIQIIHKIGHTTRTCVLKCVPGDLWNSGVYGTARYSVRSSSVNAAMTTTSTSLSVLLTDPKDYWSTTATGYDLVVLGERMRVTGAFSAPVGNVQTATVTRSMNGVVRTHGVGEAVALYRAPVYAYTAEGSGGLTMVAGGDVIAAGDINRVRPTVITQAATGSVPASSAGVNVPGISINFTTATAGAELSLWWTIRADPTGATTGLISAHPVVTGPSSFNQGTVTFALAGWSAGNANDVVTASNTDKMTLGAAGTYTVVLPATTGAAEVVGLYSQVTVMVQETAP